MIKFINTNNIILENNIIRYLILLITGVFMGYTLQPVPEWLNNIFNNSNLFKFIILFYAGCSVVYPLTSENVVQIFIASLLTIILFNILRKI
jgi:hypothetical protein